MIKDDGVRFLTFCRVPLRRLGTLLMTFLAASYASAQLNIQVNCSQWVDYPLVKKIGLYQTPLVSREWLARDLPKLEELESRSMRYEMACGKDDLYGQPCVRGTASNLLYTFTDIVYLLNMAKKYSPVLVISHGYTPTILQNRPTEWSGFMDRPNDMEAWAAINKRFAEMWKSRKYTNSYVEVWNEPDLKDGFFTGTLDDYLDIYEAAAPAVREGYADIKVGGPSGAFNAWHQPLVERALAKNLPLDFLSGHAYGPDYMWQLDAMRNALNILGRGEAEMLLTEYSPYAPADYQKDGPVEHAESAMTFFNALPGMLECTDLTHVNWAQYIDPGFFVGDKLGIIDRDSGARKALFNAFKLYGMMPADRRQLTTSNPNIKGMASASDGRVTVVLWNTSSTEQTVKMALNKLPFDTGTLRVYHIDEGHNSWYETKNDALQPSRTEQITEAANSRLVVDDVVRPRGVCFFCFDSDDPAQPLFPQVNLGTIVRTHQWFPRRQTGAAYALFDPKTWTVRLSSCTDADGQALVGIEADKMPNYISVEGLRKGTVKRNNANSTINIRVDYQNTSGQYVKSVLFHGGFYSPERTAQLPWGTGSAPDEVVEVDNLNDFTLPLSAYKPSDFGGRVILSFDMNAVGQGVKQNYQLGVGSATAIDPVPSIDPSVASPLQSFQVYTPSGLRIPAPLPGINIVKANNGNTRKIFVPRR